MDLPSILATQNHSVVLGGYKTTVKHKSILDFKGISIYKRVSPVVAHKYWNRKARVSEKMIRENFEFYKNDAVIAKTDAFVCQVDVSQCELWMPYNKSIVIATAHRYNLRRCTKPEWDRWNEHIYMLAASPRHIIGAQSFYDKEYFEHYTGLKVAPLYSYTGYYMKNVTYNPIREEIIAYSHNVEPYLKNIKPGKFKIVSLYRLYKFYELSDLVHHRAIVYFPYSVMSYRLVEFYTMGIPLFMPSMKFFRELHRFGPDRSSLSSRYCKNLKLDEVMTPHPSSIHMYSPNTDTDPESEYYWLQLSDFYWPHITHFDNYTDLVHKLEVADFATIHDNMLKEVEKKEKFVSQNWCKVIKRIESGKQVPQNYTEAIRKLYNVSRLQVD